MVLTTTAIQYVHGNIVGITLTLHSESRIQVGDFVTISMSIASSLQRMYTLLAKFNTGFCATDVAL